MGRNRSDQPRNPENRKSEKSEFKDRVLKIRSSSLEKGAYAEEFFAEVKGQRIKLRSTVEAVGKRGETVYVVLSESNASGGYIVHEDPSNWNEADQLNFQNHCIWQSETRNSEPKLKAGDVVADVDEMRAYTEGKETRLIAQRKAGDKGDQRPLRVRTYFGYMPKVDDKGKVVKNEAVDIVQGAELGELFHEGALEWQRWILEIYSSAAATLDTYASVVDELTAALKEGSTSPHAEAIRAPEAQGVLSNFYDRLNDALNGLGDIGAVLTGASHKNVEPNPQIIRDIADSLHDAIHSLHASTNELQQVLPKLDTPLTDVVQASAYVGGDVSQSLGNSLEAIRVFIENYREDKAAISQDTLSSLREKMSEPLKDGVLDGQRAILAERGGQAYRDLLYDIGQELEKNISVSPIFQSGGDVSRRDSNAHIQLSQGALVHSVRINPNTRTVFFDTYEMQEARVAVLDDISEATDPNEIEELKKQLLNYAPQFCPYADFIALVQDRSLDYPDLTDKQLAKMRFIESLQKVPGRDVRSVIDFLNGKPAFRTDDPTINDLYNDQDFAEQVDPLLSAAIERYLSHHGIPGARVELRHPTSTHGDNFVFGVTIGGEQREVTLFGELVKDKKEIGHLEELAAQAAGNAEAIQASQAEEARQALIARVATEPLDALIRWQRGGKLSGAESWQELQESGPGWEPEQLQKLETAIFVRVLSYINEQLPDTNGLPSGMTITEGTSEPRDKSFIEFDLNSNFLDEPYTLTLSGDATKDARVFQKLQTKILPEVKRLQAEQREQEQNAFLAVIQKAQMPAIVRFMRGHGNGRLEGASQQWTFANLQYIDSDTAVAVTAALNRRIAHYVEAPEGATVRVDKAQTQNTQEIGVVVDLGFTPAPDDVHPNTISLQLTGTQHDTDALKKMRQQAGRLMEMVHTAQVEQAEREFVKAVENLKANEHIAIFCGADLAAYLNLSVPPHLADVAARREALRAGLIDRIARNFGYKGNPDIGITLDDKPGENGGVIVQYIHNGEIVHQREIVGTENRTIVRQEVQTAIDAEIISQDGVFRSEVLQNVWKVSIPQLIQWRRGTRLAGMDRAPLWTEAASNWPELQVTELNDILGRRLQEYVTGLVQGGLPVNMNVIIDSSQPEHTHNQLQVLLLGDRPGSKPMQLVLTGDERQDKKAVFEHSSDIQFEQDVLEAQEKEKMLAALKTAPMTDVVAFARGRGNGRLANTLFEYVRANVDLKLRDQIDAEIADRVWAHLDIPRELTGVVTIARFAYQSDSAPTLTMEIRDAATNDLVQSVDITGEQAKDRAAVKGNLKERADEVRKNRNETRRTEFRTFLEKLTPDRVPELIKYINDDPNAFANEGNRVTQGEYKKAELESILIKHAYATLGIEPDDTKINISVDQLQNNNLSQYALRIEVGLVSLNEALQFTGQETQAQKLFLTTGIDEALNQSAELNAFSQHYKLFDKSPLVPGTIIRYNGPASDGSGELPFLRPGELLVIQRIDANGKIVFRYEAARIAYPAADGKTISSNAFQPQMEISDKWAVRSENSIDKDTFLRWFGNTDAGQEKLSYSPEWMVQRMPAEFSGEDVTDAIGLPRAPKEFFWAGDAVGDIEPGMRLLISQHKDDVTPPTITFSLPAEGGAPAQQRSVEYKDLISAKPDIQLPLPEDAEPDAFIAFLEKWTEQTIPRREDGSYNVDSIRGSIDFRDTAPEEEQFHYAEKAPAAAKASAGRANPVQKLRKFDKAPKPVIHQDVKFLLSDVYSARGKVTFTVNSKVPDKINPDVQFANSKTVEMSFNQVIQYIASGRFKKSEFSRRSVPDVAPPPRLSDEERALENLAEGKWPSAETSDRPGFWGLSEEDLLFREHPYGDLTIGVVSDFLERKGLKKFHLDKAFLDDATKYNHARRDFSETNNPSAKAILDDLEAEMNMDTSHLTDGVKEAVEAKKERAAALWKLSQDPRSWVADWDALRQGKFFDTKIPILEYLVKTIALFGHPISRDKIKSGVAKTVGALLDLTPGLAKGYRSNETYKAHPALVAGLKARGLRMQDLLIDSSPKSLMRQFVADDNSPSNFSGLIFEDRESPRAEGQEYPKYHIIVKPNGDNVFVNLVGHKDAKISEVKMAAINADLQKRAIQQAKQEGKRFRPEDFTPYNRNNIQFMPIDDFFAMMSGDNPQIKLATGEPVPPPKPFVPPKDIRDADGVVRARQTTDRDPGATTSLFGPLSLGSAPGAPTPPPGRPPGVAPIERAARSRLNQVTAEELQREDAGLKPQDFDKRFRDNLTGKVDRATFFKHHPIVNNFSRAMVGLMNQTVEGYTDPDPETAIAIVAPDETGRPKFAYFDVKSFPAKRDVHYQFQPDQVTGGMMELNSQQFRWDMAMVAAGYDHQIDRSIAGYVGMEQWTKTGLHNPADLTETLGRSPQALRLFEHMVSSVEKGDIIDMQAGEFELDLNQGALVAATALLNLLYKDRPFVVVRDDGGRLTDTVNHYKNTHPDAIVVVIRDREATAGKSKTVLPREARKDLFTNAVETYNPQLLEQIANAARTIKFATTESYQERMQKLMQGISISTPATNEPQTAAPQPLAAVAPQAAGTPPRVEATTPTSPKSLEAKVVDVAKIKQIMDRDYPELMKRLNATEIKFIEDNLGKGIEDPADTNTVYHFSVGIDGTLYASSARKTGGRGLVENAKKVLEWIVKSLEQKRKT